MSTATELFSIVVAAVVVVVVVGNVRPFGDIRAAVLQIRRRPTK